MAPAGQNARWMNAEINFGQHRGKALGTMPDSYLEWMVTTLKKGPWLKWGRLARELLAERNSGSRQLRVDHVQVLDQAGIHVGVDAYVDLLRRCGNSKSLLDGKRVHAHITRSRRNSDTFLGNLLVQMYGKCGSVEDADAAFNAIRLKNEVSWTLLITAYVQNGHYRRALDVFHQCRELVKPDSSTVSKVIGACTSLGDVEECMKIHTFIAASGMKLNNFTGTVLIKMYGKFRSLLHAREVFDKMPHPDVICWTAMITAYAQNGHGLEALKLYHAMEPRDLKPDAFTFSSVLDACSSTGVLREGRAIHARICAARLDSNAVVANALTNMYAKCGSLNEARMIFNSMQKRTAISWNTMIAAYAQQGHPKEALELYRRMDLKATAATFVNAVTACSTLLDLAEGRLMHERIRTSGLESDVLVVAALISMYGKCGSLDEARSLFERKRLKNVFVWTAIIAAYAQHGHGKQALDLYKKMRTQGVEPDAVTFVSALNACAILKDLPGGKAIHAQVLTSGIEEDGIVGNSMINLYGKCGSLDDARRVFDAMKKKDVVSWNSMIGSYTQQAHSRDALELYHRMETQGFKPNAITFSSVIFACSSTKDLALGKAVHSRINYQGLLTDVLATALVDMYSKCGSLEDARIMFGKTQGRNQVCWTAMLAAYAQNGQGKEALQLFHEMELEGVEADSVTYVSLLFACSHGGFMDEGYSYFTSMRDDRGMVPVIQHYACIVDLLGRAGWLNEAEEFISKMPVQPDVVTWMALLSACRTHNDVRRGSHIADCVFDLNPEHLGAYMLLSNMYAAAGRWNDVAKVRAKMKDRCFLKQSRIDVLPELNMSKDSSVDFFSASRHLLLGMDAEVIRLVTC